VSRAVDPWRVKLGQFMRIGILPMGAAGDTSTWARVLDVEKTRGKVTGARCWRITFETSPAHPPFTGRLDSVLRFRGDKVEVRKP
jgi:hypothetical protein